MHSRAQLQQWVEQRGYHHTLEAAVRSELADGKDKQLQDNPFTAVDWPASGALPAAGILVHQLDGYENHDTPWQPAVNKMDISGSIIFAA